MPIYEFVCTVCNHHFDQFVRYSANLSAVSCSACGATVRRVFSKPSIVFKGSGFYINDSRSKAASGESSNSL